MQADLVRSDQKFFLQIKFIIFQGCPIRQAVCLPRVAAVYKLRSFHRDVKQISNRRDDVLIARLRSGHNPSLKQYLHHLDPSQDPLCPNCQEELQDLVHWLRDCPALSSVRQRVFGCHQGSLEWLATRPGDVVGYARKTLVNLDA